MKTKVTVWIAALGIMMNTMNAKAQEESPITLSAGADLVSSYVWRGMYQTGASVQPALSFSGYGFTLGAWGSTDLANMGSLSIAKELDLSLFYEYKGLSVGVTDYWWSGQGHNYYAYKGDQAGSGHFFEASVGYNFGESCPLSIGWNTIFYSALDKNLNGNGNYSSYFDLGYEFGIQDVTCALGLGFTPWAGIYSDQFNLMSISVKGSKNIAVSSTFELPLSVEAIFSPATDDAFLVFGLSF